MKELIKRTRERAAKATAAAKASAEKETPKKAVTRPKPSFDNSQQNWCVSQPACVLSSVASVVVSEDAQGSPG